VELGFSMGWFDVGDKISLIFLEEKCDNSIYAPALVEVLGLPDSAQVGNSLVSAKLTNTVQRFSASDSPMSTTMEMCKPYQSGISKELTLLQLHHPVSPSPSTVNDWEQRTNETVSPPSNVRLSQSDPNSSLLRTFPDCLIADLNQEVKLSISSSFLDKLPNSATMRNGFVYHQDTLPLPSLENDYFWLESPGALSSIGNGRPPGQTKLETQLKKLGLLHKGEVINPVILSEWYNIPPSWLDPWESRPATALLESKDRQQEIFLTPELQRSPSLEFNTSQLSLESTTEKFLEETLSTETPEDNSKELSKETPTTEKFLEETLSTDKSRACGCLYQYIENKKLKDGSIVSYPRVEGERDKHNYNHWRWGYSWEEKIDGQWKNRSVGVPNKIVQIVANMINNGNTVQNIREFIAISKNHRKSDK
jgi:hypothetical protein